LLPQRRTISGWLFLLFAVPVFGQSAAAPDASLSAEAGLLDALKADPGNGSLWFQLGVVRAQKSQIDTAIAAFEKALPLTSEPSGIYFNLGLLHLQRHDVAAAEDAYRLGLALDSSNIPANQNYAFLLMEQGKFREAVAPLIALKAASPHDVSIRASLIRAYLQSGSTVEANAEIDALKEFSIATLPQYLELAKVLLDEREPDASQRVLAAAVGLWPASAQAHGELGLLLTRRDGFDTASSELKQAVSLDPSSPKYSIAYGEVLIRSGQYPAALDFLSAARQRFAGEPKLLYQIALAHMYLLRFPEATAELEALAPTLPDSSRVKFLLAGCYEVQGDLKKAADTYRSAIQLAPHEPGAYRALGSLLEKQGAGQLEEAVRLLRKAAALDPSDGDTRVVLARCLAKQGQFEEAAALLEDAVRTHPSSRRAHSALAELYLRQRKMDRAEQEQMIAAKLEDQKMQEWDIGRMQIAGP
jgi:tetratricopeptide (TPR) repeat protein